MLALTYHLLMSLERYARQRLVAQIGPEGQSRLARARILIIGLGALGSLVADLLARAGVATAPTGLLRAVDRDLVELTNLQRQTLYTARDLGLPKADAAARRLTEINPDVHLDFTPTHLDATSLPSLLFGSSANNSTQLPIDLIIECTDNAETRYLINEASVEWKIPWVYGGAVATSGRATAFRPSDETKKPSKEGRGREMAEESGGACLRCLFPTMPAPGELGTCDTVGVLNSLTAMVAATQVQLALRLLTEPTWVPNRLLAIEAWDMAFREITTDRDPDCPCCGPRAERQLLGQPTSSGAVVLCGRGTVQVMPPKRQDSDFLLDLKEISRRWQRVGKTTETPTLLRLEVEPSGMSQGYVASLFKDGRLLVAGLDGAPWDGGVEGAMAVYSRLVGT